MEQIAKVQEEVDGFFMNPQRKLISYMYMYLEIMCLNLIMSEVRLCPFLLQDRFIRMLVTLNRWNYMCWYMYMYALFWRSCMD